MVDEAVLLFVTVLRWRIAKLALNRRKIFCSDWKPGATVLLLGIPDDRRDQLHDRLVESTSIIAVNLKQLSRLLCISWLRPRWQ